MPDTAHDTATEREFEAVILEREDDDGIIMVNGKEWVATADGGMMPFDLIKVED
jgi:hypothetical protein